MFCIFYALFVLFSLNPNVSCNNRRIDIIENDPQIDQIIVRYKRNELDTPDTEYGVKEQEPKADKLISHFPNHNNRPVRNQVHDDGRYHEQAPVWTNPGQMERLVFVKPLNQMVSQFSSMIC